MGVEARAKDETFFLFARFGWVGEGGCHQGTSGRLADKLHEAAAQFLVGLEFAVESRRDRRRIL
ncbi:hypothetical protein FP2506_00620 [Fulvimarina pelagi HTCC2506]|uniref:Uncharacterized protein n=1 Tax=Fulvimarina pelagi HTCC2506 TaxID=314231 RepID=Q0G2H3_9HYPH|nr:hypothetical protein FP2506_00620 [Fulvimarina pelagi HTCC2506]